MIMKAFKLLLFALLIYIAIMLLMFVASLLVGTSDDADHTYLISINSLIAALPTGVLAFLLGLFTRPAGLRQSLVTGLIWTGVQLILFFAVGLGNQTLAFIFSAFGFYVLMVCILAGTTLSGLFKRKPKGSEQSS